MFNVLYTGESLCFNFNQNELKSKIALNDQDNYLLDENSQRWSQIKKVLSSSRQISDIDGLIVLLQELPIKQKPKTMSTVCSLLQKQQALRKKFFAVILPYIIQSVLNTPKIFSKPLPLFQPQKSIAIHLSPTQCACLLSISFLCLHCRDNPCTTDPVSQQAEATFNDVNFGGERGFPGIFEINNASCQAKLCMILQYFEAIAEEKHNPVYYFIRLLCKKKIKQ
ncbi:poly(ADP-ribose) glycohydrolase [Reticulomyxa filosa]|uniref:Poly(ADP-ribose) glycohydrolase n=1 Tax=Reticulomyxa filosa TaxID=46433 RepID=X6NP14_RETFI|nr:poly(ADP-ribose) glycohydrolase [Reticulomyxa filosa]|eukprot:ETO28015.1 poly(ADP-ribose) glycohydrolase [Reticulomyxa filosa]